MHRLMVCLSLVTACGGGGSRRDTTCDDFANCTQGSLRCTANVIEICVVVAGSCTDWQSETDCVESAAICDASSGTPECVPDCQDTCTSLGATACAGTVVRQCQQGTDGCMTWQDGQDCASTGQICDDSFQPVQCECDHQCDLIDDYCSGNTAWHCVESGFGCRSWETTDCDDEICYVGDGDGDVGATCGTACNAFSRGECGAEAVCEPQVDAGGLQAWICIDLLTEGSDLIPTVAALGECDAVANDGLDNQCAEGADCRREFVEDAVGLCLPYCDSTGTSSEPGATCPDPGSGVLACNAWADDVGLCAWP